MCGARSYAGAKAWALYGSNAIPWKRQSEAELPLRTIFLKGEALDAERGEYAGVNQIVRRPHAWGRFSASISIRCAATRTPPAAVSTF